MKLNEIFAKDVQRPIEGVIKADDAAHLGTEVDEYVLTNEAAKGLELLLEAYTNYTNANGVWISGFFGSGKSHLLKMLAHLLGDVEGQEFPRDRVSESFRSKAQGAFLPALLTKAGRIPAKSLLFNIDQKATLITKDQTDALLKVFVKVFDESRGYYGNQGHVARFERDLDNRGQYDAFKEAYARIAGSRLDAGPRGGRARRAQRRQALRRGQRPDRGDADQHPHEVPQRVLSVDRGLRRRGEGLARQAGARLPAELLCRRGRPVHRLEHPPDAQPPDDRGVAQHQVPGPGVGVRHLPGGHGQGRRRPHQAAGQRLLQDPGPLQDPREAHQRGRRGSHPQAPAGEERGGRSRAEHDLRGPSHANFKTLFDFVDGAKTYRNYTDETHFVGTYPFVSYQFPLFQAAIEGISDHNAFEGRNSSVGERSMLGVVQQVAKDIGDVEVGTLATFDHMFAGIRASLKAAAQRSIDVAERNLDNPLAVRLLKALFLVKYVESFQATPRNLTVLVYDRFGLDLPALSEEVKEALTLLESQTYVQRNGNAYEYLTNEEQVIEEEIKNVDIDASEVSSRLFKILSGDVIKTSKIRYAKNGQDFPFGFKLDDQAHGQQRELSIHFISPEYPYTPDEIRMHSAGKDELRVILDPDARVLSDLRLLIKTEKYIRRKQGTSISATWTRSCAPRARRTPTGRRNSSSASAAPSARPRWSSTPRISHQAPRTRSPG